MRDKQTTCGSKKNKQNKNNILNSLSIPLKIKSETKMKTTPNRKKPEKNQKQQQN